MRIAPIPVAMFARMRTPPGLPASRLSRNFVWDFYHDLSTASRYWVKSDKVADTLRHKSLTFITVFRLVVFIIGFDYVLRDIQTEAEETAKHRA
jgi:hypothetical protein